MKHHYSPDEVNTILERALAGKPLPGDMTRDQLVQLAAEVGVTPEELDAAESQVRSQAEQDMDALHKEYLDYRNRVLVEVRALICFALVILAIGASASIRLSGMEIIFFLFLCFGVAFGMKTSTPLNERRFRRWLRRRERHDRIRQVFSGGNSRRLR